MNFVNDICVTAVSADTLKSVLDKGIYGYFSNDLNSIRTSVLKERISSKCVYGRLKSIASDTEAKRFSFEDNNLLYALFYPTDNYLNVDRY